jgi:hypothetical protein
MFAITARTYITYISIGSIPSVLERSVLLVAKRQAEPKVE